MEATMMEHCQEMKQQKQKMMADMKAQDDQLMEQVAEMNRAPHDKKIGLMAAVLTTWLSNASPWTHEKRRWTRK